jgi:Arc/MetJ family transcription regulator
MQTNIDLDIELIQNAMAISGLKAKEEVVNQALKEYVEKRAKFQILKLQGELVWEGDLNKWRTSKYE